MNKTAIALGLIVAFVALVIYFTNLNYIQFPAEKAKNDYWEQEAKYSTENASLVCPPSKDGKPIPPNSCKRQDHYSHDRQQQIADHKAQLHMRNTAIGGLVIGGAGLILLWWTLSATQNAATSAAETLKIAGAVSSVESRAYVDILKAVFGYSKESGAKFSQIEIDADGNAKLAATFNIKSFGNVPAEEVVLMCRARGLWVNTSLQGSPMGAWGEHAKPVNVGYIGPSLDLNATVFPKIKMAGTRSTIPDLQHKAFCEFEIFLLFHDKFGKIMDVERRTIVERFQGATINGTKLVRKTGASYTDVKTINKT